MCKCLSDLTGLGKTYTCLTALAHLLLKHKDLVALIVVPPKALKIFRKELTEKLRVQFTELSTQEKVNRNSRVLLITQTNLSKYTQFIEQLRQSGYKLAMLLDEAHICQSEDNEFTTLIRTIRHKFPIFWMATATPCGNDIWGLYNLVSLVNPKILGTKDDFQRDFLVTESRRVKKFNPFTKRYEFPWEEVVTGYKNVDALQERIKDYVIIKQKKYNLEYLYHKRNISQEEQLAYFEASAGLARKSSKKSYAVRVNDLQRVVDNSSEKYSDPNKVSTKERLLVTEVCKVIRDHTCIIYTELTDSVQRLKKLFTILKRNGQPINNIYTITGSNSFAERSKVEDQLAKSDIVIITQAGSESINLQKSDTLFLYNAPFSIKTFIQLVGRITRTDTTFPKQYIHFIEAIGTIDTYRRLNISKHGSLINSLFGEVETLPVELTVIDDDMQQKLRDILLWSSKTRKLPTEEEIEALLNGTQ